MHTLLVIVHVSMMIASIVLMVGAIGFGLFGKTIAAKIASVGYVSTIIGTISGGILLLGAPLSIKCAILTIYLIAATLLYRYGFAFGNIANARLIRTKS